MPRDTSNCKEKLIKFIKHVVHDELDPVKDEHNHFKTTLKSLVSEQLNLMSIIIRHHECIDNLHKSKHRGRRSKTLTGLSDSMEALHEHGDLESMKAKYYNHPSILPKPHRKAANQDSFHDILLAVGEVVEKCNDELHKHNDNLTKRRSTFTLPYYPPQSSMNQWAGKLYKEKQRISSSSSTDSVHKFPVQTIQTTAPPQPFKAPEHTAGRLKNPNKVVGTSGRKIIRTVLKSNSINRPGTRAKDACKAHRQLPSRLKGVQYTESKKNHRTHHNPNGNKHKYVDKIGPRAVVKKENRNYNQEHVPLKKSNKLAPLNTAPISLSIKRVDRLKAQEQRNSSVKHPLEESCNVETPRVPRAMKCGTGTAFGIFTLPHNLLQEESFEQMCGIQGKQVRESEMDCHKGQMQDFHSIHKLLSKTPEPLPADEVYIDLRKKGSLYFYEWQQQLTTKTPSTQETSVAIETGNWYKN
ncbi:unnamed protein product [Allacma fusca]|uniref:Uncharacterized protein n=2 Tax=Allacma fusca TaxID=39272 RepID=A0A8J2LKN9_9HEXA|nr:unnamed protein product [Allacma fusca]